MLSPQLSDSTDGFHSAVGSKSPGNNLQSISNSSIGNLLSSGNLLGFGSVLLCWVEREEVNERKG